MRPSARIEDGEIKVDSLSGPGFEVTFERHFESKRASERELIRTIS